MRRLRFSTWSLPTASTSPMTGCLRCRSGRRRRETQKPRSLPGLFLQRHDVISALLAVDLMIGGSRMEIATGLALFRSADAEVELARHGIADRPFAGLLGKLEQGNALLARDIEFVGPGLDLDESSGFQTGVDLERGRTHDR